MNNAALLGLSLAMAISGLVAGLVYFAVLRCAVASFFSGQGWLLGPALAGTRFAVAAIPFWFAAGLGAIPLLGSLLGFVLAQQIALRAALRTS
ncbi:MAG TPA: ATP synthase subunit I [Stellaceae bacterium]|nr:ATP synthase subunit I [Stellaceae bacterium]